MLSSWNQYNDRQDLCLPSHEENCHTGHISGIIFKIALNTGELNNQVKGNITQKMKQNCESCW